MKYGWAKIIQIISNPSIHGSRPTQNNFGKAS